MDFLYIDPGAGSMVIQAVLAGLLAIPFIFRGAVSKAIHRFTGRKESRPDAGVSEPDGDA
jgi:hypothetical protein